MAFGAKKIYPVDTKPGVAVGVNLPFNAPAVFKSNYTTKDAIRNNLINYFLTNKNERYLSPEFGSDLRSFIFEQISSQNLDSLEANIQTQLSLYFPSVIVDSLNITPSPDYNEVSVILKYQIEDTGINDEIQLTFV